MFLNCIYRPEGPTSQFPQFSFLVAVFSLQHLAQWQQPSLSESEVQLEPLQTLTGNKLQCQSSVAISSHLIVIQRLYKPIISSSNTSLKFGVMEVHVSPVKTVPHPNCTELGPRGAFFQKVFGSVLRLLPTGSSMDAA